MNTYECRECCGDGYTVKHHGRGGEGYITEPTCELCRGPGYIYLAAMKKETAIEIGILGEWLVENEDVSEYFICSDCDGSGVVDVDHWDKDLDSHTTEEEKCDRCAGSGDFKTSTLTYKELEDLGFG